MTTVTVLMGGPDAEREVSIASGTAVAEALRSAGSHVEVLCIDQPALDDLEAISSDVVFPVLHGPWGEGGPLQRLLESCGHAFVGSGSAAAALCMDKAATKRVACDMGIPTPNWAVVTSPPSPLEPPVVVKPVDDGSSVALSFCQSAIEADHAVASLIGARGRAMVEQRVRGREMTAGVLEGCALPLIEVRPFQGVYDYAAKYERDDTAYITDPDVDDRHREAMQSQAVSLTERLGVRDLARVDFILDDDTPWMLEVNTMPGFTAQSLLPKAASARGWDLPALCDRLVTVARDRARLADAMRP